MAVRLASIEVVLADGESDASRRRKERSRARAKGEKLYKKCGLCGENTKYEVCGVCMPKGQALEVLADTYVDRDENGQPQKFQAISPIIQDIYTVLATKGTMTLKRLAVEVHVTSRLATVYVNRLMKKHATVVKFDVRSKLRGSVQTKVALTDEGKRQSVAYKIIREFEQEHGLNPFHTYEEPKEIKKSGDDQADTFLAILKAS